MHTGLERAAAGEEDHQKQGERADRGLVGERIRERVQDRLKDESRVQEADRAGIGLPVGEPADWSRAAP
jgi:hypothetical protein